MTPDSKSATAADLLPCPFCGGIDIHTFHVRDGRGAGCTTCHAKIIAFQPNAEVSAIAAWNRRAEASPPLAGEGWRPIETAPKDGTRIIGSTADDETAFICAWFCEDEDGTGYWLQYGSDIVSPIRWIPIPNTVAAPSVPVAEPAGAVPIPPLDTRISDETKEALAAVDRAMRPPVAVEPDGVAERAQELLARTRMCRACDGEGYVTNGVDYSRPCGICNGKGTRREYEGDIAKFIREAVSELSHLKQELAVERDERRRISDLCDETEHERAAAEQRCAELERACAARRWNIDDDGENIQVCRDEHDKGEKCEFETFVPLARAEKAEAESAALRAQLKVRDEARDWRPMHGAPQDGSVIEVVGRYVDATAGFPRYAHFINGCWRDANRPGTDIILPWAWRPRTDWPHDVAALAEPAPKVEENDAE